MARPTKLTESALSRIELALRSGAYWHVAAASAGVDPSTLRRWLHDQRPRFRELRDRLRRAEAEGEVVLVGRIMQGAAQHPTAALRMLERRYPLRWGPSRWDVSHPDPLAIPDEPAQDPDAQGGKDRNMLDECSPEWRRIITTVMTAALLRADPVEWFERQLRPNPLAEYPEWHPFWEPSRAELVGEPDFESEAGGQGEDEPDFEGDQRD